MQVAQAQLRPIAFSRAHLKSFVGDYGAIRISFENGTLLLNRSDRPRWQKNLRLEPVGSDDTFQVQGTEDLRLRFTKKGLDLLHGSEKDREPFERKGTAKAGKLPTP